MSTLRVPAPAPHLRPRLGSWKFGFGNSGAPHGSPRLARAHRRAAGPALSESPTKSGRVEGFTLVELMVVILIISLLATLAIANLAPKIFKSKVAIARANMKEIENAVETFYMDQGRLPEALQDLINRPGYAGRDWPEGGYLKTLPKDPWNGEYHLVKPGAGGRKYDIVCYGADGAQGGDGDNKDISIYEESTPQ